MPLNRRQWVMWSGAVGLAAAPARTRAQVDAVVAAGVVLGRLREHYQTYYPATQASEWLSRQAPGGEWSDVDYADRSLAAWRAMPHLERLRSLSVAVSQPKHALYGSVPARRAIESGLRAWVARKPASDSWWHNTIGQQLALAPILVLANGQLPRDLGDALTAMLYDPSMVEPDRATGQNLVWYATEQLVRGALRADGDDLRRASDALQSSLRITRDEGLQADFSFHQHGPQLYSGGYGLGFLTDSARAAAWLAGTPWAFDRAGLELLADYALLGVLPLVRGDWLDWGARGREFTRREQTPRPRLLLRALQDLEPLVPSRASALARATARLASKVVEPVFQGNRYFWRSDFMVHQTSRGYMSLKMVSRRTVGTESGNGENLLGYWLPFGVTYLLKQGDEYDQMPPVWDWAALPGLTAPNVVPRFTGYQRHDETFVGGLSDGRSGVAAMRMNKADTAARRSWYFVGDLMVALGSAISSSSPEPVRTTLDQRRARGPAYSDAGLLAESTSGALDLSARRWVWHDGVTYLVEGAGKVRLDRTRRVFTRDETNTELGRQGGASDVFMLTIDHGGKPRDAAYRYAVWLGAAVFAQAGAAPAFNVLSNSAALHAVHHPASGLTQAVFWEPGALALAGAFRLAVDTACIVTIVSSADGWRLQATDPSQVARKIGATILWPMRGSESFDLVLPVTDDGVPSVATRYLRRTS